MIATGLPVCVACENPSSAVFTHLRNAVSWVVSRGDVVARIGLTLLDLGERGVDLVELGLELFLVAGERDRFVGLILGVLHSSEEHRGGAHEQGEDHESGQHAEPGSGLRRLRARGRPEARRFIRARAAVVGGLRRFGGPDLAPAVGRISASLVATLGWPN